MNDGPRRRRGEPEGGGLPLIPLVIVVVFVGLLLGGVLAHFSGSSSKAVQVPTAMPSIAPVPSATSPIQPLRPSASPKPSAAPSAKATKNPKPAASANVTPPAAPSATPPGTPGPSANPSVLILTPAPLETKSEPIVKPPITVKPMPLSATTPVSGNVNAAGASGPDGAASVVRSYLQALARGDQSTATSYLEAGLPSETFMTASPRINSIHTTPQGSKQFKVTADVTTTSGEYFITFVVEPGPYGMAIASHDYIKVQ